TRGHARARPIGDDLQIVADPPAASLTRAASLEVALGGVFTLVAMLPLVLRIVDDDRIDGPLLDVFSVRVESRRVGLALLPRGRRQHVPVNRIPLVDDLIERKEHHLVWLREAACREVEARAGNRRDLRRDAFDFAD